MTKDKIQFPKDEGAHKEIIEWWYLNGHVESGTDKFSYALAYFKVNFQELGIVLEPITPKIGYVTHLGITDLTRKKYYWGGNIFAKLPIVYKLDYKKLNLRYGQNFIRKEKEKYHAYMMTAGTKGLLAINLEMTNNQPPLFHGRSGVINMADLGKSYYYSLTNLDTNGYIRINRKRYNITGQSWMDHQWGPFYVNRETGWNWFSIYLADKTEIMAFNFYNEKDSKITPSATIRYPDGKVSNINNREKIEFKPIKFWKSKISKSEYPIGWQLKIKDKKEFTLEVKANMPEQEVVIQSGQYWEGSCRVSGKINNKPTSGKAYLEMTGYDRLAKIKKILQQAKKIK